MAFFLSNYQQGEIDYYLLVILPHEVVLDGAIPAKKSGRFARP